MGIFGRFEKKVEGAVNGAFARAFKGDVQPVEIAARLQRELDAEAKLMSRDKRLVPNEFVVGLSSHDHDKLAPYSGTLTTELAAELRHHASEMGYVFSGPIRIHFEHEPSLPTGRFTVSSRAVAGVEERGSERRASDQRGFEQPGSSSRVRRARVRRAGGRAASATSRALRRTAGPAGARGQRHPPHPAAARAWSSAAARRPTCGSTTRASPVATPRSGSRALVRPCGSRSSTSGPRTGSSSTATRSGRPRCRRARGSRWARPGCSCTHPPVADPCPKSR